MIDGNADIYAKNCAKKGQKYRNEHEEIERQKPIEKRLDCKFLRIS